MVAFNLIATLFLAISLAAAQPINEQLVGRDMSSQVVSSRFESLSKEVSDIRQSINNGLSQTEARQRIEKMASSASQTFRASQQCTTCFGQGTASSWSHSASSTYKEISSLAQTVNQKYGSAAPQVFSSVRQLDGLMSQNLNSFSRSGVAVQSLLPSQSAQVFGQLGLSQTAHIAKETSSSSSSSSMTQTGGPGGMSTQVVSSRFESLSREVSDIRQSINNGLSQTEARQRIEKLASSASQTFRASQQCITCFDQGTASSWSHSASSTYKEISSLAQTVNQKYGSAAPQVFSPVRQLDGLMSQNLNSFSRSGVAVQSLLPSQSAQVFGQLGLSQTAHIAKETSSSSSSMTQTGGSGGMSTQVVSSRFESLSREVSDIRQSINNGLSQTEARQRIEKLASSASQTFRASQQCITCFDQGTASSWSHSASSTYKEISSLAQTVNQKYGSAAPQVFSPVRQLDGLMSQNLNSFSRSGVAVQSLLPSQSAQVFGQLGLSQTAHIANHTSSSQTGGSSPHP